MDLEDKNKNAFQGDMVPEDTKQLKGFVENAEQQVQRKQRGSFGAGKPWKDGIVNYCFHEKTKRAVKEAVHLAIQQYKKAVPCLQFNDVGRMSGNRCEVAPAILIKSEDAGCWSYVGMLDHREVQELNLQSPGCDSVGTALHEMGHALGMAHEQSRPDRDKYVKIHESEIKQGKAHNFDISRGGDTERPYDLLSIMHYEEDSFSVRGRPTITAKAKAYELYTDNPSEFKYYKMGNRVGLTQLDADQLSDLYRPQNPQCMSHLLGGAREHAACSDLQKSGAPWKDRYDQGCQDYVKMEKRGHIDSCGDYSAGTYCCDCGGGLRLQEWAWECDLCRKVSLKGCQCKEGPWTLFNYTSSSTCGNPGHLNHFPSCVVDEGCADAVVMGGKSLAPCKMYTGFTTKGCRCRRYGQGFTEGGIKVEGTCGNPNDKFRDWCYVEESERKCQGGQWGFCEKSR